MNKVFAVLVTYFPELADLQDSISILKEQCEKVIICNNSDPDLNLEFDDSDIKVFNFGQNMGIAHAQSVGMSWAFSNGADYILQLDQDSKLADNTVFNLLSTYNHLLLKGFRVGAIGPRHFDKLTKKVDIKRLPKGKVIDGTHCEIVQHTLSSACLIPKVAFDIAGNMEDALFIDLVDWEYCWRLKSFGFITVRDNDVLLAHRVGDGYQQVIGSIDARIPSPVRHYYHTRNVIHMLSRRYVPLTFKIKESTKIIIKLSVYYFTFEDGAIRVGFLWKGVVDGFNGVYGKISD